MIEWKRRPRGTYQTIVNDIELDVWHIGVLGWRFNASKDGQYLFFEQGLESLDVACEHAIKFAETYKPRLYKEVQP